MTAPIVTLLFQALTFLVGVINTCLGVVAFISQIVTTGPFLIFLLTTTAIMYPVITYQDDFIEEIEFFMRTIAYPFYQSTIRPILIFFQYIYNNLICWFNSIQYWIYGLARFVIFPTFDACNINPTLNATYIFIGTVIQDFWIGYFFESGYFYGPVDFTNITATGIDAWLKWVDLYTCTCSDLGDLLKKLPIFPGFIPILGITSWTSIQWADPYLWKGIEYAVDGFMEILNQLLRLAIQGTHAIYFHIDPQGAYAEANFTRPDFYLATDYFVNSTDNIIISYENAIQRFWDMYIPFPFDFHGYFCWLQSLISFLLKTANFLVTMLINIDKLLRFPSNDFWSTTARGLITENLNLLGAPTQWQPVTVYYAPNVTAYTMSNYYLPESDRWIYPLWTNASLNPLYQKKRFSQCFCEFLTRTFCDPTNNGTACFPNSLLSTFDFCCLTNNATTIALDVTTSFVEFTYHLSLGGDDIVLFVTNQPFSQAIVNTLVSIVKCLFSLLTLIPEVGVALQNFFTEGIAYWIYTIHFISIFAIDASVLPFYNVYLPLENATIEQTGVLLNMFTAINDRLVADTPNSFMNSMCLILNNGFPIPPVPCLNCTPGGFVSKKRAERLAESLGWSNVESAYRITPIWYYNKNKTDFSEFGKRIWMNAPTTKSFPLGNMDGYFDEKKNEFLTRWTKTLSCTELKSEEKRLKATKPHVWRIRKMEGRYDCNEEDLISLPGKELVSKKQQLRLEPELGSPADISFKKCGKSSITERQDYPPPVATCDATTECFDLCCFFRALVQLFAHSMNFFARFINGFVQYQAWRYPGVNADFPYFTGESCDVLHTDCFESDLIKEVMLFFRLPVCLCNFLNLVVPLSTINPRNNICCSIQKLSDLLVSTIMVIINSSQNIAYGAADGYAYFRDNFFKRDVDVLFEIAYEFVDCLCELLNYIFPISYIPGLGSTNIDVCCTVRVLMQTIIELGRFGVNTLIALATFTVNPDSFCYFRLDTTSGCGGTLDRIGIVIAMDLLIDTVFTIPNPASECVQNCPLAGNGAGLAQCTCNLITSLIPIRQDPSKGANCSLSNLNCDTVDLCCFINQAALVNNYLLKFLTRAGIALFQPWTNGLPMFFIRYFACDESAGTIPCGTVNNACAFEGALNNTAECGCGTYTCGKFQPVIDAFTSTLSKCLCVLLGFIDDYIAMVFTAMGSSWSYCFCGSQVTNGIFQTWSASSRAILTQFTGLVRKFSLPCYWNPSGKTQTFIGNTFTPGCIVGVTPGCYCKFTSLPMSNIEQSWVYSFVGPILETQCASIGKLMCFATSIFFLDPACNVLGERFLGSYVVFGYNLIVRILALIEGFALSFVSVPENCLGSDPLCNTPFTATFQGLDVNPFAQLLQNVFQYPFDFFFGDSAVACSRICPNGILQQQTCDCYRKSPTMNGLDANFNSIWNESTYYYPPTGQTINTCLITTDAVVNAKGSIYRYPGINNIYGVGSHHPRCAGVNDWPKPPPGIVVLTNTALQQQYPGVCSNYVMCRPDVLPQCALPPGAPPAQVATSMRGPVDGLIMGIIRLIQCLIPKQFMFSAFKPALFFGSIIWQLSAPLCRIAVAIVFVLLSIFASVNECDCLFEPDPQQNNTISRWTAGRGIAAAFCYPCPDNYASCGLTEAQLAQLNNNLVGTFGGYYNKTVVQRCEPQCPCFMNASNSQDAIQMCVAYSTIARSTEVARGIPFRDYCSGYYEEQLIYDNCGISGGPPFNASLTASQLSCYRTQKQQWYYDAYKQQSCHFESCQFGMPGTFINFNHDFYVGSTFNANPVPDCNTQRFLDAIVEFGISVYALFTTPLVYPDYKRNFDKKEGRLEFWKRNGISKSFLEEGDLFAKALKNAKRDGVIEEPLKKIIDMDPTLKSPEAKKAIRAYEESVRSHIGFEQSTSTFPARLMSALYEYDSSDCFTDPVSCVCRNFYMPNHCTWDSNQGIAIPTPGRKIYKRNNISENLSPESEQYWAFEKSEIYLIVSELFDENTVCDHTIKMIASDGIIGQAEEERWVSCIDQRIQSERLSEVTKGVFPRNYAYNPKGVFEVVQNIATAYNEKISNRASSALKRKRLMMQDKQETERLNNFYRELAQRRIDGEKYLRETHGITKESMTFELIVQLDQFYAKYESGYYHDLFSRAYTNYLNGLNNLPTTEEALYELKDALFDLKKTVGEMPYREAYHSVKSATSDIVDGIASTLRYGVINTMSDLKRSFDTYVDHIHKRGEARREVVAEKWRKTPLYKWWYSESPPETRADKTTFFRHISNVMAYRRAQRDAQPSAIKQFKARFVPQWTDEQLNNWRRVGNVFRTFRAFVYPDEYTDSSLVEYGKNERFLVDGNCQLFNNLANYSINLFTPCLQQQVRNTRALQGGRLEYYVDHVVPYYRGNYLRKSNTQYMKMENMTYWKRWKTISPPKAGMRNKKRVDHRIYKRAIASYNTGPAGFNLYDWAVAVLETWFNFLFTQDLNTWIDDANAWITNPNTEYTDFLQQNVGLRYWALFMIRCNIPENTNCVGGIGLGPAILWVSLGTLGLAIVGAFFLPVIAQVLAVIPVMIIWLILVGTIGLHYSPRCALLGISLTPFSFVLPECLMDEIIAILDKIITNCYSPWLLPSCMIAGDLCPTDPNQYIDWLNCQVVGVSDGIQNVLFFVQVVIGQSFANVFLYLSSATFGHWLPGLQEYMQTTLDGFKYAGPSQLCRQWWCFGLTFPAIAFPVLLFVVTILVLGFILPFVLTLLLSLYSFWAATPAAIILPGNENGNGFDQEPPPAEEQVEPNVSQPLEPETKAELENMEHDIENAIAFNRNYKK